jgi:hypothetical protein
LSDPISDPNIRGDRSPAAPDGMRSAKSERERRVVEGLKGGLPMAEIARREGIPSRGYRKYFSSLFARRAPEATGEFIATQMSRLNEALIVSFGAMSGENLPAADRVVRIVRERDRYQGLSGGARGTEARRKLLESLNSGAETDPCAARAAFARAGLRLLRKTILGETMSRKTICATRWRTSFPIRPVSRDLFSQGARGTGMRRNPLESLDSGAGTMPVPLAPEDGGGEAAQGYSDLISELTALLAGLAPQGWRRNLGASQPAEKSRFASRSGAGAPYSAAASNAASGRGSRVRRLQRRASVARCWGRGTTMSIMP